MVLMAYKFSFQLMQRDDGKKMVINSIRTLCNYEHIMVIIK